MNFMRETEQYYDWLYKIVCGEWEPRNLSFHRLLMYLFNRDYIPACEMDVCRATDGINLRYRFASENNIPYGKINAVFQGVPCSMLEMMVALAIRIEEHIMEDRSMATVWGSGSGAWSSAWVWLPWTTPVSAKSVRNRSWPGLWIGTTSRMEQVVSLRLPVHPSTCVPLIFGTS